MSLSTARIVGICAIAIFTACADFQAPEKCDDLANAICANVEDTCIPLMSAESCLSEFKELYDCSNAFDVSDSYEDCMDEVASSDECLPDSELPSSCHGTILFQE